MSVKRDTTPRMTTFTVSPYARDRRVAMVSRRMEEERDGDDRVDHYEQCALVPVASPIRDDSRDDSRRQGQGRELEDFEVEGHDLRGQERNENEDRRHEQRDLGRRRRRDGDAQFHLVPPGHEDRTPMFCGVSDDGHDDDSDEQLGQAEAQPRNLQGTDQDLALDGDQDGRCHDDAQCEPFFPTRFLRDLGDRIEDVPMRPQGKEQAEYVGEEQEPGDAQAHCYEGHAGADDRGEHVQGGHHETDDRDDEHRDLNPGRLPGEVLRLVLHAPREHAQPEDQQKVPDDRAGERCLDDFRQTARQRKDRDDEFGRVPECRVQEAADAGTGVFAEFLRGEAEEPGERDDGETRDREDDDAGPEEQVEDPTQWDKEPQQERPGVRLQRLKVLLARSPDQFATPEAAKNFERLRDVQILAGLDKSEEAIAAAELLIDALLGIGVEGPLREPYAALIRQMNASGKPILSVDVPSGFGTDRPVRPTVTVTLHDVKEGMTAENSGRTRVADIGIPTKIATMIGPGEFTLYPVPRATSHKGQNGRVLVIAGGPYTGAPALVGYGALGVGADLIHVATPALAASVVASYSPMFIVHPLVGHRLLREDTRQIVDLAARADAIAIGPGLGDAEGTLDAVKEIVRSVSLPLVVDADAVRAVASDPKCLVGTRAVITPHSREIQTLTGRAPPDAPEERAEIVREAAKAFGATILLKGHVDIATDGTRGN